MSGVDEPLDEAADVKPTDDLTGEPFGDRADDVGGDLVACSVGVDEAEDVRLGLAPFGSVNCSNDDKAAAGTETTEAGMVCSCRSFQPCWCRRL